MTEVSHRGAPRVCVILVNWNGWRDTVECLESLFRLEYPAFQVVVCDNGSGDGSVERIAAWARGGEAGAFESPARGSPVPKPIPCVEYTRGEAEGGGRPGGGNSLVLVRVGANLGFAGGNNVGLRYALAGGFEYAWLLNNDTVVRPEALSHLVRRAEEDPGVGLCGSTLLYYDQREVVQAWGGASYNAWTGVGRNLGIFRPAGERPERSRVEGQMAYVAGASMLVRRGFLEAVGLMDEGYFLYFEELDWTVRAAGRYRLGYAPESVVYHKEGRSIGTSTAGSPSAKSLRYLHRGALRFTRKHYPARLPFVAGFLCLMLLNAARKGRWADAGALWSALRGAAPEGRP